MEAWQSYDSLAEVYDRLAGPRLFAQPARDLVSILGVPAGGMALDVGTGTGVCARMARLSMGPSGVVAGIDPSLAMLRVARRNGVLVAAASAPGLPFGDSVFDVVFASFVLSHFPSYETALLDMVRVLKPGGRLGATSWCLDPSECRQLWQETAESFIGKEALAAASREALPWEEWFSGTDHVQQAYQTAGLASIEIQKREYTIDMPVSEFLDIRAIGVQARFISHNLAAERWEQFKETVAQKFHARFGGLVHDVRSFYVALGTHPRL
jgi:arsenite methyltransferase